MSTAQSFLSVGSFPFCVTDISGDVRSDSNHVDNLTLSQVMAFGWNLESLTLTTSGTVTVGGDTANGALTFTLNPLASDRLAEGINQDSDTWLGDAFGTTAFASWPPLRVPRERICYEVGVCNGTLIDVNTDGDDAQLDLAFAIGTDPVNAGKYRLYYRFRFTFIDPGPGTVAMVFKNVNTPPGGMSAITSGTVTIGGLTMNYYSFKTTGASSTGGTMTVSSSDYTY